MKMTSDFTYINNNDECPWCHSPDIHAEIAPIVDGKQAYQEIECTDCGKYWRDLFQLVGYEEIHYEPNRTQS